MLTICRLTLLDALDSLGDIRELDKQLTKNGSSATNRKRLVRAFIDPNFRMFGALDGPRLIGMTCLVAHHLPDRTLGTVHSVVVNKPYRGKKNEDGKKISERLFMLIIEEARRMDIERLDLTSNDARIEALAFYTKLGFTPYATNTMHLHL